MSDDSQDVLVVEIAIGIHQFETPLITIGKMHPYRGIGVCSGLHPCGIEHIRLADAKKIIIPRALIATRTFKVNVEHPVLDSELQCDKDGFGIDGNPFFFCIVMAQNGGQFVASVSGGEEHGSTFKYCLQ